MNLAENDVIEQNQRRQELLAVVISLGMKILSERLLTLLVLLLDGGIFAWAISTESIIRLVGAVLFAVAAQFLIHWRPKAQGEQT